MSLQFLAFSQKAGFTDSWPLDVMAKVMGQLAKANPQSTIKDVPGSVAFLWDSGNKAADITLITADGEKQQTVKPKDVLWLDSGTTVVATNAAGATLKTQITAEGELRLPKLPRRPSRAP
jgi:hypothetical protein